MLSTCEQNSRGCTRICMQKKKKECMNVYMDGVYTHIDLKIE